jgi:hypothetical protein
VLPGAFSAYRWDALKGDATHPSILKMYLKQELEKGYK